jgi:hypothetical protein
MFTKSNLHDFISIVSLDLLMLFVVIRKLTQVIRSLSKLESLLLCSNDPFLSLFVLFIMVLILSVVQGWFH